MTRPHSVIEDIGAELGYTATATLVSWFGGTSIYIPLSVDEAHFLARLIGLPAYRRLVAAFPGESIRIPKPISDAEARARRVLRLLLAGRTEREIVDEIGITPRRVQQLRKRFVENGMLPAKSAATTI